LVGASTYECTGGLNEESDQVLEMLSREVVNMDILLFEFQPE
jgi:hypothetical protein